MQKTSAGMNKQLPWIILIAVAIIVGGLFLAKAQSGNGSKVASEEKQDDAIPALNETNKANGQDKMMRDDTIIEDENALMDEGKMEDGSKTQVKGSYVEFSPATLTQAQKNGKTVLFFHAKWCPFCKTADSAFKSNADEIPEGVTVLKTDYDSNSELKTKYGVTTQHTFVQIDAQGNQITKWISGDIDELKANLK